jgi:hypothetical protein
MACDTPVRGPDQASAESTRPRPETPSSVLEHTSPEGSPSPVPDEYRIMTHAVSKLYAKELENQYNFSKILEALDEIKTMLPNHLTVPKTVTTPLSGRPRMRMA